MIRVQREDFDIGAEIARLSAGRSDIGGVASFVGLVRGAGSGGGDPVSAMTLEHYPGMTEKALAEVEGEARRRWSAIDIAIIHRFGKLLPGERIVFVGVAAAHRGEAFAACEFLVDWLKTRAPFWKLEEGPAGSRWVEARAGDDLRAARWRNIR
jgi:molybdopterin synthase catalytic subunit